MQEDSVGEITVYGAPWCGDCKRAKKFLGEQRVHYRWFDIDEQPEHQEFVERVNQGKRIIPTIVFGDGSILVEPTDAEIAAKLGLQTQPRLSYYDLIVIGGGPAGLTAALYAAREGYEVVVIERSGLGGQASLTERLDNFPGFPEGISGGEFADRLTRQAERFGVELVKAKDVIGLRAEGESKYVFTSCQHEYGARAVLITTGATYRRLGAPGEAEFIGAGVHFCATCDGPFYRGQPVAVVGGGNSAAEESLFLTRFASKVTMLVRGPALSASKAVVDKVSRHPQIEIRLNTEVVRFVGGRKLQGITVRDRVTGATDDIKPKGAFIFIGQLPNTAWLPPDVARDPYGYIITSATLETSMPGVFAAGDARLGSTKQAASAAGEGAAAALQIRDFLRRG